MEGVSICGHLEGDAAGQVAEAAARLDFGVAVAAGVAGVGHDDDVFEVRDGSGEHARVAGRPACVAVSRQLHHLHSAPPFRHTLPHSHSHPASCKSHLALRQNSPTR